MALCTRVYETRRNQGARQKCDAGVDVGSAKPEELEAYVHTRAALLAGRCRCLAIRGAALAPYSDGEGAAWGGR